MENHLEMAKTGKEFIYGITDAAETTDTTGKKTRGKCFRGKAELQSEKEVEGTVQKASENTENFAAIGP